MKDKNDRDEAMNGKGVENLCFIKNGITLRTITLFAMASTRFETVC